MNEMEDNYEFFLRMDIKPYRGEWIAICERKVISHGPAFCTVRAEADKLYPAKESLFGMIPREGSVFY